MKQKLKSGDEYDAVSARKWYTWKAGRLKKIKRAINKRFRKQGKQESEDGLEK